MQPFRRPIAQPICLLCSHLQAHRAISSSPRAYASSPRERKPKLPHSENPNQANRPKYFKRKSKSQSEAKEKETKETKETKEISNLPKEIRRILSSHNPKKTQDANATDLDPLPSLTPRQHISATGSAVDSPRSSSVEFDYPEEPIRPPSFVPRIPILAEELIARQARARALKEWSDLDIDLNTTPSPSPNISEFVPSISDYSPSPNLSPPIARYPPDFIYPPHDGEEFVSAASKPTRVLQLRNIGMTPLPSDIYGLIADKENIPRWRNEEVYFSAFWGRNPRNLNKEGVYHLIWPEGSHGQLSDAGMDQDGNVLSRKGSGRGPAESRAETFRQSFIVAVREGDRFPAAIHAREEFLLNPTPEDTTTPTTPTPTTDPTTLQPLPKSPTSRILRPHQTIPLPHPAPNPSASYLPTKQLLYGTTLYLNFLTSSRPPCPPGNAVLLYTSSQGGTAPVTGKLPRTREILERLMTEEFELIGSITHDTNPLKSSKDQLSDDDPPDASSVVGTNALDQLSEYIPNYDHFAMRGKWNTESLLAGANEERFGITRFVLVKEEDDQTAGKRKESGRRMAEKRQIVGAEGKWIVRLASRTEAGRLVRTWHMREWWSGIGGERAEKVVMRAEIL